jgi:hypothetical protein
MILLVQLGPHLANSVHVEHASTIPDEAAHPHPILTDMHARSVPPASDENDANPKP